MISTRTKSYVSVISPWAKMSREGNRDCLRSGFLIADVSSANLKVVWPLSSRLLPEFSTQLWIPTVIQLSDVLAPALTQLTFTANSGITGD